MPGDIWQRIGEVDGCRIVEIPLETAIYILPPGACFATEDQFKRVLTVQYIGTQEAYLRGLEKGITPRIRKFIRNHLFESGIKVVRYRHRGKERKVINPKG